MTSLPGRSSVPVHAPTTIHVLWATSERYPKPQFVAAFNDGLVESWTDYYYEQREKAEQEWPDFGDDPEAWTFWTEALRVPTPDEAPVEVDR